MGCFTSAIKTSCSGGLPRPRFPIISCGGIAERASRERSKSSSSGLRHKVSGAGFSISTAILSIRLTFGWMLETDFHFLRTRLTRSIPPTCSNTSIRMSSSGCLQECVRVLKDGGGIRLIVPEPGERDCSLCPSAQRVVLRFFSTPLRFARRQVFEFRFLRRTAPDRVRFQLSQ